MQSYQYLIFTTRRLARLARLLLVVGVIPLFMAGCYRGFTVLDHLDIQSGSLMIPSVRLGTGDRHLFCQIFPSDHEKWSVTTWHDYDRDCPSFVMFVGMDVHGNHASIDVGYVGLIPLSVLALIGWHRRDRRAKACPAGGFEGRPNESRKDSIETAVFSNKPPSRGY